MSAASEAEDLFWSQIEHRFPHEVNSGAWVREHRFHPTRKWRFDFANLDYKIAVEIVGVMYFGPNQKGGHQTAKGIRNDCMKYNEAIMHGWTVLQYPHDWVRVKLTNRNKANLVKYGVIDKERAEAALAQAAATGAKNVIIDYAIDRVSDLIESRYYDREMQKGDARREAEYHHQQDFRDDECPF